jgi:glycosyltransferase involved in cell wall biosynthesis
MGERPLLSLVLACYNEEEILASSFAEIRETLEAWDRPYEILFVDDCSRDRTRELLARIVAENPSLPLRTILHEKNLGRGATVMDGFRAARGEITGYLDVDLEVHSRYIPSLVAAIQKGADVATVQRIYAFQLKSIDRYVLSRGYSALVRRLLHVGLRDTETGYKFFRRETLLPVLDEIQDRGWFWDTVFMVRALHHGLRIVEIPGAYVRRYDKASTVRGIRDSIKYFGSLMKFRAALRSRVPKVGRNGAEAAAPAAENRRVK